MIIFRAPHQPMAFRIAALVGLAALALLLTTPSRAHAAVAQCRMGFLPGSTIANGQIDGVLANDWLDASVLQSGDPCFGFLRDWDGATPTPPTAPANPALQKRVKVFSKRDSGNIYLAFEVRDQTQDAAGALLANGDRVVIQIDPDPASGSGTALANDFRIEVSHRWNVSNVASNFFTSSSSATCSAGRWLQAAQMPAGLTIGWNQANAPNGDPNSTYWIELKIPLSVIGNPAGDIGIAIAVINDLGHQSVVMGTSVNDATGLAYPSSLPMNNAQNVLENPQAPTNCDWNKPGQWATGQQQPVTTGDVTISSLPEWWRSSALVAATCQGVTYEYYPGTPCRLKLTATVNSTAAGLRRNLLFMWADHGSSPSTWRAIELVRNVVLPQGPATVSTDEWKSVPKGLANHPCVRVYILPEALLPAWDEAALLAISDQLTLTQMEAAYGFGGPWDPYWTQKNISKNPQVQTCPDASCRVGQSGASHLARLDYSASTVLALKHPGVAQDAAGEPQVLGADELKELGATNAIVRVQAFGFSEPQKPTDEWNYNFIEDLGGVIHLVAADDINAAKKLPFELQVTNPGDAERGLARSIILAADVTPPTGAKLDGVLTVSLPQEAFMLNRGETIVIQGAFVLASEEVRPTIAPTSPPAPTPVPGAPGCKAPPTAAADSGNAAIAAQGRGTVPDLTFPLLPALFAASIRLLRRLRRRQP